MNKIEEVMYRFRSGSISERKDEGGGEGLGVSPPVTPVTSALHTLVMDPASGEGGKDVKTSHADSQPALPRSPAMTAKSETSVPPLISPAPLQLRMATDHADVKVPSSPGARHAMSSPTFSMHDKKSGKCRPKGVLEYKVVKGDTLEKIAAHFDVTPSELKKLNRMSFPMVFENQVLYIPDPNFVPSDPPTPSHVSPLHSPDHELPKIDIPIVKMADRSPAAVPGHVTKVTSPTSPTPPPSTHSATPLSPAVRDDKTDTVNEGQPEHFIRLSAQFISEGFEKVPGTLLVTPNTIMFDPDVTDDRVIEEGAEHYGAIIYLDTVISAAIYQDLSALRFQTRCTLESEGTIKPEVYRGKKLLRSASESKLLDPSPSPAPTPSPTPSPSSSTQDNASQPVSASKSVTDWSSQTETATQNTQFLPKTEDWTSSCSGSGDQCTEETKGVITQEGREETKVETQEEINEDRKETTSSLLGTESGQGSAVEHLSSPIQIESSAAIKDLNKISSLNTVLTSAELESKLNRKNMGSNASSDAVQEKQDVPDIVKTVYESQISNSLNSQNKGTCTDIDNIKSAGVKTVYEERHLANTIKDNISDSSEQDQPNVFGSNEQNSPAGFIHSDVHKRSEELVTEIFNEVTSVNTQHYQDIETSELNSPDLQADGAGGSNSVLTGAEDSVVIQDTGKEGEEMRIGNIVYLPIIENSDGEMVVDSNSSALAPTSTEPSKPKPPPLKSIGMDATDSASSGDATRPRAVSDTQPFSPLKTSAQQISNFVNYATGIFRSSVNDRAAIKDVHALTGRGRSSTMSEVDKKRRGERRLVEMGSECIIESAVKMEERPELFRQVSDLIPHHEDVHKQPAIYLHVRVDRAECDRRVTTSTPCESYRHQTTKPHYWFSLPKHKADHLYAFFIHWRPDIYGDDDINPEDKGFVVVDRIDITQQAGSLPVFDDHFGSLGSAFKKDWEIISREEFRRRSSVAVDLDCLPELAHDSSILMDRHILMLSRSLPARTVGYKWSLAYSTSVHGFSLKRLYRELCHIDSPILLVLLDSDDVVFGAYLSHPPKLSDHFYGTGTCQLWTFKDRFQSFSWSGFNHFFIRGDENSFSVGACQGVYGLWLDNDLYHGRSRECSTFRNCVLSGQEDFIIQTLEAWAFDTC